MQMIPLGSSGRETTRLGFGGSSLMGALGRKESLRMLESAWDAGIRHFDVAPSYGYGQAEGCLGEFLARHPGQATVTTKFGIAPPGSGGGGSLKGIARNLARPLLKAMPGLKAKLAGAAGALEAPAARPEFTAAKAQASLDRSLAALGVERIDVWLLHEAEAADLVQDALLRLMQDSVAAGTVGTFGVGSEGPRVAELLRVRPEYCAVVQYEWSVLDSLVAPGESFRIHHRSLTENFRALHAGLEADPARLKRWSEHVGADLGESEVLANLMLKAALVCNPESVILFSSKQPEHVQRNVAVAEDASLAEPALKLYSLVRAEAEPMMGGASSGISTGASSGASAAGAGS